MKWHRLFGLALTDFFTGTAYRVELEIDLSLKQQYRIKQPDGSTMFYELYNQYQIEGITMPYTWSDFQKDFAREHISWLTPEERLAGLSKEEILNSFSVEEILKIVSAKKVLKALPKEEILKLFSKEELEAYLKKPNRQKRPHRVDNERQYTPQIHIP
jgi:hypothetical protein